MTKQTLFGYLAPRFTTSPENIATEALNYILNQSPVARKAFMSFLQPTGVSFPGELYFSTQSVGEDQAISDLVGTNRDGQQILLVEAKFWAGLTKNQPVTYLKRLPDGSPGLLLFIAPALRLETLWPELVRRCKNADIAIESIEQPVNGLRAGQVSKTHILALASWRSVLSYILRTVETSGETEIAADVMQLQGLCERMDSEAFLPLRPEEFSSIHGRRTYQYCELVDDVINRLKKGNLISTKGYKTTAGLGWYGRGMKIHDRFGGLLKFDAKLWSRQRETPLWFRVWFKPQVKECLERHNLDLLHLDKELFIPLYLPTGVERNGVVDSLVMEMTKIIKYLKEA